MSDDRVLGIWLYEEHSWPTPFGRWVKRFFGLPRAKGRWYPAVESGPDTMTVRWSESGEFTIEKEDR